MKTDLYTKTILTVIAICLTINILKGFDIIPKAYANETSKKELVLPEKNYGLVPVNKDGTIDVNIKSSSTMDVNIESIERSAYRYVTPLDVRITRNDDK